MEGEYIIFDEGGGETVSTQTSDEEGENVVTETDSDMDLMRKKTDNIG